MHENEREKKFWRVRKTDKQAAEKIGRKKNKK